MRKEKLPGGIEIWNSDYRELMEELADESVDMVLTDPPYGIDYQNNFSSKKYAKIKGDTESSYKELAEGCYRVLKDGSHAYFFTRFDVYPQHYKELEAAGFSVKNVMVVETGTVGGLGDLKGTYSNNSEWVIYCHKGRRVFEETELMRNKKAGSVPSKGRRVTGEYKKRFPSCWFGEEYPKSTYNAAVSRKKGIHHPTSKNVDFLRWLIELSSKEGELVYDPYMGSGSTAVACKQTGRLFKGSEIVEEYYNLSKRRIKEEV